MRQRTLLDAHEPPQASEPVARNDQPDRHESDTHCRRLELRCEGILEGAPEHAKSRHDGVHQPQHHDEPPHQRAGREHEHTACVRPAGKHVHPHQQRVLQVVLPHLLRGGEVDTAVHPAGVRCDNESLEAKQVDEDV
eukprot:1575515-Prymnesium_polylepis.1